jgi:hypothetical protein
VVEKHHMRQFLLYVFILLIPCFTLWTVASGPLAIPAMGFVNMLLTHWFPDVVNALYSDGSRALLMTEFGEESGKLIPLGDAEYRFGFEINTRVLSYSLPFYTALHFATQKKEYFSSYIWGLVILYPLMALGLASLCVKELMIGIGKPFFEQPDVFVPDPNLIALLYQFNVLIVPTLAPAIIWVWQSRDAPLLRDALGAAGKALNRGG